MVVEMPAGTDAQTDTTEGRVRSFNIEAPFGWKGMKSLSICITHQAHSHINPGINVNSLVECLSSFLLMVTDS